MIVRGHTGKIRIVRDFLRTDKDPRTEALPVLVISSTILLWPVTILGSEVNDRIDMNMWNSSGVQSWKNITRLVSCPG